MYSKVISAAICGIESKIVSVEVDVTEGLPQFSMVGYLTSEVKEAQDRVRTALRNSGYRLPAQRVTVNMAPADIRKSGSGFDLPLAIAVLAAYGILPTESLEGIFLTGELGLDGRIHGVHGVLGMVIEAQKAGCTACILPEANAAEGSVIQGVAIYSAGCLREVAEHMMSGRRLQKIHNNIEETFINQREKVALDFSDIKGQHLVRRAAEVAASGMHNMLISGPPGSGKSMIASRIPGILPPMDLEEALEVSQIHSVAGILPENGILTQRPFRAPHHTVSGIALAGGGIIPRPGEISLAHRGLLYLDELPEFQKDTLEILRQPLEEGRIHISRNSGQYVFPSEFMLVASRNNCKCGYWPDASRCRCTPGEVRRYLHRISRPLLDRIDIHVESRPMQFRELTGQEVPENSAQIRSRVLMAHKIQKERYRGSGFRFNSELDTAAIEKYCALEKDVSEQIEEIYEQKNMTARAYHRMLKVARTIADLDQSEEIHMRHLGEAMLYRPLESLM